MAAALLLAVLMVCVRSSPNHDDMQAQSQMNVAPQEYDESTLRWSHEDNNTRTIQGMDARNTSCQDVQAQAWRPINIGYTMLEEDIVPVFGDNVVKDFVTAILMPKAMEYLRTTLRTHRVFSLHADHARTSCYANEWSSLTTRTTTTTVTSTNTSTTTTTTTAMTTTNTSSTHNVSTVSTSTTNSTTTSTSTTSTLRGENTTTRTASSMHYTCTAEAPTCGADHLRIPDAYLTARRTCYNCSQPTAVHQQDDLGTCEFCDRESDGFEAHGYDFFTFVTIMDGIGCTNSIKAYSSSCVRDQCDRPVFGALNFCASQLLQAEAASWRSAVHGGTEKIALLSKGVRQLVSMVIHEFTHMLVFSSALFRYFRNEDGSPQLLRDAVDESKIVGEVPWSCVDYNKWTYPNIARSRASFQEKEDPNVNGDRVHVDLVAEGMVGHYSERGLNSCGCPVGGNRSVFPWIPATMDSKCLVKTSGMRFPHCVLKLQTPKVVEAVRSYFGCPSLPGAELENQGAKCTIFNSHWEQRIFMGELMTAVESPGGAAVSEVTLALFQDSGWYRPNYSKADPHVPGVSWGYQQGCNFATGRCVADGKSDFPRHFCASGTAKACSPDRTRDATCKIKSWPDLPDWMRYISGNDHAGTLPEADYCPLYDAESVVLGTHICDRESTLPEPHNNINFMREVFGTKSKCLESTMYGDVLAVEGGVYLAQIADYATIRPSCFQIECAADGWSYTVTVADLREPGQAQKQTMHLGKCWVAGDILGVPWLQGHVTCASPVEICTPDMTKHYWYTTTSSTSTTNYTGLLTNQTTTTSRGSTVITTNTTTTTLTTTSTTSTTTSTTSTTIWSLFGPKMAPATTTTTTTSTQTTSTSTDTTTSTNTSSTFTTTTVSTTTTPTIDWVECSMTVIVYDLIYHLDTIPLFLQDMTEFKVFERTLAKTVWGVNASMVKIMGVYRADEWLNFSVGQVDMSGGRRLLLSSEALAPKELGPSPPPPALRRLGALFEPSRWLADEYVPVPQQTPLEKSGVKIDGKSGWGSDGVSNITFEVDFRVLTGKDKILPFKVMRELNQINFQAITELMAQVMLSLDMPRSYRVAIVEMSAQPGYIPIEGGFTDAPDDDQNKTSTSLARRQFRPSLLFSVAWPFVLIVGVTPACVVRWL